VSKTVVKSAGISLSDTFAFTGTVTGAGTLVKTGSVSSTSDAATYSVDGCFSSAYLNYFVTFRFASATDGNQCHLKFRTSGTANTSSSYQSYIRVSAQSGGVGETTNSNGTSGVITTSMDDVDNKAIQGFMYFFAPLSTTFFTQVTTHFNYVTNSGTKNFCRGGIMFEDTTSFDGFQIGANTGNGSLCDINVYGIVE
jgi:hypothetical protein